MSESSDQEVEFDGHSSGASSPVDHVFGDSRVSPLASASPLRSASDTCLKPIVENKPLSNGGAIPEQAPRDGLSSPVKVTEDQNPPRVKAQHTGGIAYYSTHKKGNYIVFSEYSAPELGYLMEEYQFGCVDLLEQVNEWDFPIFDLEVSSKGHILSQVSGGRGGGRGVSHYCVTIRWPTSCSWRLG